MGLVRDGWAQMGLACTYMLLTQRRLAHTLAATPIRCEENVSICVYIGVCVCVCVNVTEARASNTESMLSTAEVHSQHPYF